VVRAARNEVRDARQRLKQGGLEPAALREAERTVSRAAAHVALGGTLEQHAKAAAAKIPGKPAAPVVVTTLAVGATVRVKQTGTLATVEAVPERGSVRLRAGAVRLTLSLGEVEPTTARSRTSQAKAAVPRAKPRTPALAAAVRTVSNTLDLRGTRVDEGLSRLDAFLDVMMGEGEPVGFVLHGHGTGAMKEAAREHLAGSAYVEHSRSAEPDEGGDAFTVFWMRD
jgi:DNA mismatch repair protein MutS2